MRILLPTDFSKNAWQAIEYALFLFEKIPCQFYVLHAHQVSPSGLVSTINKERDTRLFEITLLEAQEKLNKIINHLNSINKVPGRQFVGLLEPDSLLNAIGRHIIDQDIDYVFMGTQGATGMKEVFLGSNTVRLIRNIENCPVMVVPEQFEFGSYNEILFATDFKHHYKKVEIQPLLEIAKIIRSSIIITHIAMEEALDEEQKQLRKLLGRLLEGVDIRYADIAYYPDIASRIQEWSRDVQVGMITMINCKHGFFSRLLREPVVKRIAFHTEVPFLVLPEIP
ncbi:universal stress protein [Flavobacteriaceae bacterium D16]|nr:universal stress protein [Flavobacteriaceae bacterium D16]